MRLKATRASRLHMHKRKAANGIAVGLTWSELYCCCFLLLFGCLSHCQVCCFLPSSGVTVGISVSVVLVMIAIAVFIGWLVYRRIQRK